jgi:hypothetical protein
VTKTGTTVVIADDASDSALVAGRVLDDIRAHVVVAPEFLKAVQDALNPGDTLAVTPHSIVPPSVVQAPIE